jgi:hypothetical protein
MLSEQRQVSTTFMEILIVVGYEGAMAKVAERFCTFAERSQIALAHLLGEYTCYRTRFFYRRAI